MGDARVLGSHILPILRRIGMGCYPDLEKALRDADLPDGVVRDLHRFARDAEDAVARQRRRVTQPWRR